MKLTLHEYQENAAEKLAQRIREALTGDEEVAITVAAPTGAGKTIIAAAALELLYDEIPTLTVLWVSTDKELNAQSRDKFKNASAVLAPRLTILDNSFTEDELARGKVSFINTDKLGRGSNMTKVGEARAHTIWDAINNTVARNAQFVVMVDEAHLGTGSRSTGDDTLLTQLMNGTGQMHDMPRALVGISATAQRFEDRIAGTREVTRRIPISRDDLKSSGLVKDRLLIAHPDEEISSDATLLAVATEKRRAYEQLWAEYTEANDEPTVTPALLLQVAPKTSVTAIGELLTVILDHDDTLTADSIFHTFESHKDESFGKHTVRYGAPSDLQRLTEAKIILAKDAVTTGWDAPRVEVLVSLRGTADETVITQLIGRAVRQPLAKRVADDRLNAVHIFLPHFREKSVDSVIARLADGDDAVTSEVIVEAVSVAPNPAVPQKVWEALRHLPSWTRPRKTARTEVERSSRIASILSAAGVLPAAAADLDRTVLGALRVHLEANREFVDDIVRQYEEVDYVTREVTWAGGAVEGTGAVIASESVVTLRGNVLDLYKRGVARYPGGAGKKLWTALCDEAEHADDFDAEHLRLVVAALGQHPDTAAVANAAAETLRQSWVKEHVASLSSAEQADVYSLIEEATEPEQVTVHQPTATQVHPSNITWPKHLLSAEGGTYPDQKSNSWESRILAIELTEEEGGTHCPVAWYRNPTSGRHALAIPYADGTLYPDFLFFREKGERVLVDIVDPHRPDLDDTKAKWVALSEYASKANAAFAEAGVDARVDRVLAVIEGPDKRLLSVNLAAGPVARAISEASGEDDIRAVFDQFGGRYKVPAL